MSMVWADLVAAKELYRKLNPSQRDGQALFNVLYAVDPEAADLIRGTSDDCFYRDERIPLFAAKVKEIWASRN